MKTSRALFVTAALPLTPLLPSVAYAQYPTIYPAVEQQAGERMSAANKRSDVAFTAAQPVLKEWAAKGKPYIPSAAKPTDLPQASIPAFPGAQGYGRSIADA